MGNIDTMLELADVHNQIIESGGEGKKIITPEDDEFQHYGAIVPLEEMPALCELVPIIIGERVVEKLAGRAIDYERMLFRMRTEDAPAGELYPIGHLDNLVTPILPRSSVQDFAQELSAKYFRGQRVQLGLCWGYDTDFRVNAALEDHLDPFNAETEPYSPFERVGQTQGSCEIIVNIAPECNLLVLGKSRDVENVRGVPTYDARKSIGVLMPNAREAGYAVLLYADTLHFNPKGNCVMSVIMLEEGTNADMDPRDLAELQRGDASYFARMKRVFAVDGSPFAAGTKGRVVNDDYMVLDTRSERQR